MKLTLETRLALGRVLASRRSALNLTQEKLAALADIPVRTLQRAERGDGISKEYLDLVADALGADAAQLIDLANQNKAGSPDLRQELREVLTERDLLTHCQRPRGAIQVAPEGEDGFNDHIGAFLLELTHLKKAEATQAARYALNFSRELGYSLFALRYQEELPHGGKVERYPTTLILAAPLTDPRIRKTAKGRVLDYVTDRRKQLMHRVLKRGLTAYDWLEDLYISKSNGEERVRAELLRIHLELRAQNS